MNADELILAHLEVAGPSTTQEIAADLPTVGRAAYARLRSLWRRGRVGRLGPLPGGRSVLWFLIGKAEPLPVFESGTGTDHEGVTFTPADALDV